jgi:hypothetical protein
MASAVFIVALVALVFTAVAASMRERPLVGILSLFPRTIVRSESDTTFLTAVVVIFDLVALVLLLRFGVTWS